MKTFGQVTDSENFLSLEDSEPVGKIVEKVQ
jgi:hypothetical protein